MLVNGDSTLVITPKGKKILIDGGEEENNLVQYLLARKIKTLDYVIISHFDSDHSGGIKKVLTSLNVKKLLISRQIEKTDACTQVIEIAKEKNVKIIFIEAGQKINIEKNIILSILWPILDEKIMDNPINNNSIVATLEYKKFQILFTGDIEEEAEQQLVKKYGANLKATILKVAHHGAETSTTQEFINTIKPKIALIGVR